MDERVTFGRITLQSCFVFRGAGDSAESCGDAFGLAMPTKPCTAVVGDGKAALWLGPDEWLLMADARLDVAWLRSRAGDMACALVDVSSRDTALDISGPAAALLLNAAIALDLSETGFPPGACSRTLFAKVGAILWRIERDRFRLLVARSHADYAEALLEEAARSMPED